jgi:hypothetical protein
MKIIQRVFRWLFRGETKYQKPHAAEKADEKPADQPQKQPSTEFYQDDSPPGYKVRWHH